MFRVDLSDMLRVHSEMKSTTTLALKEMFHFDRYGIVKTNDAQQIISFEEKQYREKGWINGGIYFINKAAFEAKDMPKKFSFEKDYLEQFVQEQFFFGYSSDAYFIDIGIPEDYAQARIDFSNDEMIS
jgi:D-glycero-alpha-D-manno-heptose 1-phosphate guanylyltransferase